MDENKGEISPKPLGDDPFGDVNRNARVNGKDCLADQNPRKNLELAESEKPQHDDQPGKGPDFPEPPPANGDKLPHADKQGPTINADRPEGPNVIGNIGRDVATNMYRASAARDVNQNVVNLTPEVFEMLHNQKEVKPLLDLADHFAPSSMDISWLESAAVAENYELLRSKRLLFILCPDRSIARASAWAIVREMGLTQATQTRLLDFQRIAHESARPDIYHLRRPNENQKVAGDDQETVLVVDAVDTNVKAREFLDLFLDRDPDSIGFQLQQERVSLLYLVDSGDIQAHLKTEIEEQTYERDFPFPDWRIPFLRPVLKPHFATNYLELEEKIEAQRDRWPPGDKHLFWIIKDLIRKGILPREIDSPATALDERADDSLFNGNDPIPDTVVYVAAFFPNLNSREFQRIVALLLGEKTRTITVEVIQNDKEGVPHKIDVKQEKALVAIWEESMDQIKRQCSLITTPSSDGTRTVDFKDHRLTARVKNYLEDEFAFFVGSQFTRLFEAGVLFDPSPRIGENMVALTAAAAASDPEYYGRQLVTIIGELEAGLAAVGTNGIQLPAFFKMLVGLDKAQAIHHTYQRLSALLRALLEVYRLRASVDDLLEQMMRRRLFEPVLQISRRLRSAAEFDEAYWLKQLVERGNKNARLMALSYLYGSLKRMGASVYQVLAALDSWIPSHDSCKEVPSASGREALSLLIVYCIETTGSFDPKFYGDWPSRYPLFAFRDAESAEKNLNLLARMLLHPWMKCVLADDDDESGRIDELIAALIFQWMVILIGPSGSLNTPRETSRPGIPLSANEVQRILIRRLVAEADNDQRQTITASWRTASAMMINQIERLPYGNEDREELVWKRNLLEELATQFRDLVTANESSLAAIY
jgi:hypothetical protein